MNESGAMGMELGIKNSIKTRLVLATMGIAWDMVMVSGDIADSLEADDVGIPSITCEVYRLCHNEVIAVLCNIGDDTLYCRYVMIPARREGSGQETQHFFLVDAALNGKPVDYGSYGAADTIITPREETIDI